MTGEAIECRVCPWRADQQNTTCAIDFSQPLILCMPGFDTKTLEDAGKFTGFARKLLGALGAYDGRFNVYSVAYPEHFFPDQEEAMARFARGDYAEAIAKADLFAEAMMRQIFAPAFDTQENTSRALSNLTLFTHSFGTSVLQGLNRRMFAFLSARFGEAQADALMRNAKVVSIGDVGMWQEGAGNLHFTAVHLVSDHDHFVNQTGAASRAKRRAIMTAEYVNPGRQLLLRGALPQDSHFLGKDEVVRDEHGHHPQTHVGLRFADKPNALFARTLMQSALRNALKASCDGTPIDDPAQMLEPVRLVAPDQEDEGYLGSAGGYRYTERMRELMRSAQVHTSLA